MKSFAVEKTLKAFGHHLQVARKKRKISVSSMAERMGVSRQTVMRLERGDPAVRIEFVGMALLVLGELHRLEEIMAPTNDEVGLLFDQDNLPKRIRGKNKPKANQDTDDLDFGTDNEGLSF